MVITIESAELVRLRASAWRQRSVELAPQRRGVVEEGQGDRWQGQEREQPGDGQAQEQHRASPQSQIATDCEFDHSNVAA
jgi:hypothetical protein